MIDSARQSLNRKQPSTGNTVTGHVVRLVRDQIGGGVTDVFRQSQPSPGQTLTFGGDRLVRKGNVFSRRVDPAGLNGS